jgi:hypothetical protein
MEESLMVESKNHSDRLVSSAALIELLAPMQRTAEQLGSLQ